MKSIITFTLLFIFWASTDAQIYVKQDASGDNDGSSWVNAFTDLQEAIDAAVPGTQIWIAAGTYVPGGPTPDSSHFITLKSLELYGGFSGTESNLSERDWQQNLTILSGDINGDDVPGDFQNLRTDNAHHVLIVNAPLGETIIDGLLFQGGMTRVDAMAGDASDIPYHRWKGGGLYIYKSTTAVRNCTFRDNYGTQGTGIYATGDSAQSIKMVLENSLFELNASVNAGACWISGWNDVIIRGCIFQHNNSNSNSGALALGNIHARIEDCLFDQNFATGMGGSSLLFNNSLSFISHPTYQFSRCEFTGNSAPTGGAVRLNNFASSFSLTFDSCSFAQNRATNAYGSGGALYVVDYLDAETNEITSSVRIDHSTFTDNTATYGGAIEIDCHDDSLRIEVAHSGFFNNTAADSGGGLYAWMVETSKVYTKIENSDFDGNTGRVGGGLILDSYYNVEPMSYAIDSCNFSNNTAELYGGAIGQFLSQGPGLIGSIRNTQFLNNQAKQAGALVSRQETLLMEDCLFSENYAEGFESDSTGGGAIVFLGPADIQVRNSIFEKNRSEVEGSAVINASSVNARYENVLFQDNHGPSTFVNRGDVHLVNTTMSNNDYGLLLEDTSVIEIQNSIFNNINENLRINDIPEIITMGGNLSSDASMSAVLTGNGNFNDFHNTDPLLGPDFVPLPGSPAVDAGNPEGVTSLMDLAGNPRIQGSAIDIGSFESFLTSIKDVIWDNAVISIYPNPVNEILNLKLESPWLGEIHISIYNQLGQKVYSAAKNKVDNTEVFQENVLSLINGQYFIFVKAGYQTYASTIIIQR